MKKTTVFLFVLATLHSGLFASTVLAGKDYKAFKSDLLKSRPSQADIRRSRITPKGATQYFDCWSFCDEVCLIRPGGVCYCEGQSYDCGGEPESYPLKRPDRPNLPAGR